LSPAEGSDGDGGSGSSRLALDQVLWSRILRLPTAARNLLELIAVSGRPLRLVELGRCVDGEPSQDERMSLALLRAGRLIRSSGRADREEVEPSHDRVRETIVARLEPDVVREHHRCLARVLESSGQADPEILGVHFLSADLSESAVVYFAQAADQAAEALAF